jgi:hypothetical protein
MRASKMIRAAALAAPVTALALADSAAAASANPAAAVVFRVPVTGTLDMVSLPPLAFTGTAQITYPPQPIFPPQPIKPVSTVLRQVTGTGGGLSCDARGAQTFKLNRATDTLTFTGTYKLYPPTPIRQNDACTGRQIGVQYVLHLDAAGQVTGTPTATAECIELNCNTDTP